MSPEPFLAIDSPKGNEMDESSWNTSTHLTPMLIYLRGEVETLEEEQDQRARIISNHGVVVAGHATKTSEGRLARFAAQCCKKWWGLPLDEWSKESLTTYERFLIGECTWLEFTAACSESNSSRARTECLPLSSIVEWSLTPFGIAQLVWNLSWTMACYEHRERIDVLTKTASEDELFSRGFCGYDFPEFHVTISEILRPLPSLLRDVVGNPFVTSQVQQTWLTSTTIELVSRIEDDLAFDRLPELAAALEKVGCRDANFLDHCREPKGHVRGCWVIDRLLGRE